MKKHVVLILSTITLSLANFYIKAQESTEKIQKEIIKQASKKIKKAGYKLDGNYLTYFAAKGDMDWVQTYLNAGIDPNSSVSPFYDPNEYKFNELQREIRDSLGQGIRDIKYPIIAASAFNHYEIVKLLIEKGANVNVNTTEDKWTPLMYAAKNRNVEMVKMRIRG